MGVLEGFGDGGEGRVREGKVLRQFVLQPRIGHEADSLPMVEDISGIHEIRGRRYFHLLEWEWLRGIYIHVMHAHLLL